MDKENEVEVSMKELQTSVKNLNALGLLEDSDGNKVKIKYVGVKKEVLIRDFQTAVEWLDDNNQELDAEFIGMYNRLTIPELEEIDSPAPSKLISEEVTEEVTEEEVKANSDEVLEQEQEVPEEAVKKQQITTPKKKAVKAEKAVKRGREADDSLPKFIIGLLEKGKKKKEIAVSLKEEYPEKSTGYINSLIAKVSSVYNAIELEKDNAYRKSLLAIRKGEKPTGVCSAIYLTTKRYMHLFE